MTTAVEVSLASLDLLLENKELDKIREIQTDYDDAVKVILYLRALVGMVSWDVQKQFDYLELCFDLCVSHGLLGDALDFALMMRVDQASEHVRELYNYCSDLKLQPLRPCAVAPIETTWRPVAYIRWHPENFEAELKCRTLMRTQMTYKLAEHRFVPDFATLKTRSAGEEPRVPLLELAGGAEAESAIDSILRRDYMPSMFDHLVNELDVVQPKKVEDILRSEESSTRGHGGSLESSRVAMASSYVSGFVHAGYGVDSSGDELTQKTRHHGITAAIASIGLLNLWRVEQGLSELDKYQYSQDNYTRAGALIGFGCCNSGTYNDCDPVLSLGGDSVVSEDLTERMAAYISLGYAYFGTQREDIFELLLPALVIPEPPTNLESRSIASLALGFVYAGSGNDDVAEVLLRALHDRPIDTIHVYNFGIALGLIYLMTGKEIGKDTGSDVAELLDTLDHSMQTFIRMMIEACAFACTGDVMRCQRCLTNLMQDPIVLAAPAEPAAKPVAYPAGEDAAMPKAGEAQPAAAESDESEAKQTQPGEDVQQTLRNVVHDEIQTATAGLALIAYTLIVLGENVGEEMALRLINHVLQYDSIAVRRAVPLALALLSPSAPKPVILDVLSKLTHDPDADTALHAILALGVVAAGTNNARAAQLLRSLASFYSIDGDALFLIKLSQGLVHSGKGLHTLSALHNDKKLVIQHSLAGLLAFVVQGVFTHETLCQNRYHLNILHLCLAIRPRWLITVDENDQPVPVQVRVGQFVDVAGIAGQPRQVAGFRTHNTPVILSEGEKAELGCAEWQPLTSSFEGIVVVRRVEPNELKDAIRALE